MCCWCNLKLYCLFVQQLGLFHSPPIRSGCTWRKLVQPPSFSHTRGEAHHLLLFWSPLHFNVWCHYESVWHVKMLHTGMVQHATFTQSLVSPSFPSPSWTGSSQDRHTDQGRQGSTQQRTVNTHSHTDEDKRTLESMRRWVMLKSLVHWWNKRTLSSHVVPGQFRAVVSSQISCHFQRANQQSGHQTFWHPVATVSTQDASFNGISCVSNDQTLKSQSTQHLGQVSQLHFCQVSWIEEVVCG